MEHSVKPRSKLMEGIRETNEELDVCIILMQKLRIMWSGHSSLIRNLTRTSRDETRTSNARGPRIRTQK